MIFVCRRCGNPLTAEVSWRTLPPPVVEEAPGPDAFLPPRMPPGTYAQSAKLGGFVLNPDDVTGAELHPDPGRRNGCCRLDGLDGPNLVCIGCGAEVAIKQSDCWSQQQVTMIDGAIRPVSTR